MPAKKGVKKTATKTAVDGERVYNFRFVVCIISCARAVMVTELAQERRFSLPLS
jgi:hypothetical protein